jgi:hypothetical protein
VSKTGAFAEKLQRACPWRGIEPGLRPYVLHPDREVLESFNATAKLEYRIQLDVYPEPFIGDPAAPILILSLNPGFKPAQVEAHAQPDLARLLIKSMRLEAGEESIPFHHLHPDYQKHSPSVWWPRCLKGWIDRYGLERVSHAFFCVELFPYASKRFKAMPELLDSQRFGFEVARAKIEAGATVIAFRAKKSWAKQLAGCASDQWITPLNPQASSMNPPSERRKGNIRAADAERIAAAIESA